MTLDAQSAKPIEQLHGRRLPHLAIGVADDGDFFSTFEGASQRKRTGRAAQRAGDDVAGIAQPNELVAGQTENIREKSIEPRINAGERHDRKFIGKVIWMQPRMVITLHCAVIGVDDRFEEAHAAKERSSANRALPRASHKEIDQRTKKVE